MHEALTDGVDPETVADEYGRGQDTQVDVLPLETGVTLATVLTDLLDYLHHEALYVVDSRFEVTAYRTLWFGLQYESDRIDDAPTLGYGAVRTVRWCDGEPAGDDYLCGQFAGLKRALGAMIDRERIGEAMANQFLHSELVEITDGRHDLRFGDIG
ncbi:hypothetical protein GRX01_05505 [Halobaculum sp. WSA2]|uniref:Uncharacterized protein n=2 Tax=Halobaculum saliterrae TaxID=2073113 RepID=A0A6B0ST91_9EURY|nr:hypothetical protein [Halobaculum saliterrae]